MNEFSALLRRKLSLKPSRNKSDQGSGEGPTLKLPPEILGAIFRQMDRNSIELVRITAVCARWRTIAVHAPYLWTSIKVHVEGLTKKRTRVILARVDLFLSRTGDLPLDVEWHAYGNRDSVPLFYDLFRRKGFFSRWKTLSLDLNRDIAHPLGELRESDRFSRLQRLCLVSQPPPEYLERLNKTVTTKLYRLELACKFHCPPDFNGEYSGLLAVITALQTWSTVLLPAVSFPPNVTRLNTCTLPDVPMPHIQHIVVGKLGLAQIPASHLLNITTLRVCMSIDGPPADFAITLPNLLWLGLEESSFNALSAFKVPSLQTLVIQSRDIGTQTVDGVLVSELRNGFHAPGLLRLQLNIRCDGPTTLEVLRLFPELSLLYLYCYDAESAQRILLHVFPKERGNFSICPSMNVIRIALDIRPFNEKEWKDCVWDIAPDISESLRKVESLWTGGAFCWRYSGHGRRKRVKYINPWHMEES